MEKLKSNWKVVVYWFVVMFIVNVFIVPKYVTHEPITTRRAIVGGIICFILAIVMGLITKPAVNNNQK
jgi:multidrug resistance efflux pump